MKTTKLNTSRKVARGTEQYNGNRACESLEPRRLFAADMVPIPPQQVNDVEYSFETAPHQLRFTFNQDVRDTLDTSDLSLVNMLTRQVIGSDAMAMQYDTATNSAMFTFPGLPNGVMPDGNWKATLSLTDEAPPAPTPPTQSPVEPRTFPEEPTTQGNGSGNEEGKFTFMFQFLRGDATHDGNVDANDFLVLASNFGRSGTFSHGDFDYSGTVDGADFTILAQRFGVSLPPPALGQIDTGPSCGEPAGFGDSPIGLPTLE